jgi:hypothetical protein
LRLRRAPLLTQSVRPSGAHRCPPQGRGGPGGISPPVCLWGAETSAPQKRSELKKRIIVLIVHKESTTGPITLAATSASCKALCIYSWPVCSSACSCRSLSLRSFISHCERECVTSNDKPRIVAIRYDIEASIDCVSAVRYLVHLLPAFLSCSGSCVARKLCYCTIVGLLGVARASTAVGVSPGQRRALQS